MDSNTFWISLAAAIGTVISAAVAVWSLIISNKTWKNQVKSEHEINYIRKKILEVELEQTNLEALRKQEEHDEKIKSYFSPNLTVKTFTILVDKVYGFKKTPDDFVPHRNVQIYVENNYSRGVAYDLDVIIEDENGNLELDPSWRDNLPYPNLQPYEKIEIKGSIPPGPSYEIIVILNWRDDYGSWKSNYKVFFDKK